MTAARVIKKGYIPTSAAYAVPSRAVAGVASLGDDPPRVGDVVYGRVLSLGQHRELENRSGRIHRLTEGAAGVFVYGNRYATDAYEALVPDSQRDQIDLVARSGIVGEVRVRSSKVMAPTTIQVLGRVVDRDGRPVNTRDYRVQPRRAGNATSRGRS